MKYVVQQAINGASDEVHLKNAATAVHTGQIVTREVTCMLLSRSSGLMELGSGKRVDELPGYGRYFSGPSIFSLEERRYFM
jgi:hypothetical protein